MWGFRAQLPDLDQTPKPSEPREEHPETHTLLGGSWVLRSRVISTLNRVLSIVTTSVYPTLPLTTPEPSSTC